MNIESLVSESFLSAKQDQATRAIAEARAEVTREGKLGATSVEVVMPDDADEDWLGEGLLRPLIYFCQSSGAALPDCSGVFVSLFYRGHIHFVLAAEVIAWACAQLGIGWQELVAQYGTGERQSPAQRAPGV